MLPTIPTSGCPPWHPDQTQTSPKVGDPTPRFRTLSDNTPERVTRLISIGRKNWLFARSDSGGETLSRAMSLVETAKMNGLYPQAWLAEILDRIHNHMTNPLNEPLPWNWTPMN